jgi:hypothetical protein
LSDCSIFLCKANYLKNIFGYHHNYAGIHIGWFLMKHFSFSQVVTDESSLLAIGLMEGGSMSLHYQELVS